MSQSSQAGFFDEQGGEDDRPIPLAELIEFERSGFELSDLVRKVLERAGRLHEEAGAREPINTSLLLFAMIEHGRHSRLERRATIFLADYVFAEYRARYETCRREYFAKLRNRWDDAVENPRGFVTANVRMYFRMAANIAARVDENTVNASRLLAAVLLDRDRPNSTGAIRRMYEIGLDPVEIGRRFGNLMAEEGPIKERALWAELFPSNGSPVRRPIARFNADLSIGDDRLDITPHVTAMANLIMSRMLEPPLSIGLFGNWGSGKSFFMEQLRKTCEEIAIAAGRHGEYAEYYWKHVVQVRFNAWNYVDANLWASLVSHLFEELCRRDSPDKLGKFEEARREAIANLQLAQDARIAVDVRTKAAKESRDKAQSEIESRERDVRQDRDRLADAIKRDVWESVGKVEVPQNLKTHFRDLGIDGATLEGSARQIYDHVHELTTLAGRLRMLWLTLTANRGPLYGTAIACIVVLVASIALSLTDAKLAAALLGVVGEVGTVISGSVVWLHRGAKKLTEMLKPVYELRATLDAAVRRAENEKAAEIAKLQSALDQRQAEYEAALRDLNQATAAVRSAQAALADVQSGRHIIRFIEERIASGDYHRQLGIVATIRKDVGRLDDFVGGYNKYLNEMDEKRKEELAEGAVQGERMGINRIVLYIDDLDRCPPARVVEVLQAIHLLLAFPLFVVVVAVDARWVSHSLEERYPQLLIDPTRAGRVETAGPRDYLEKIFQVPFRVRPMNQDGCRKLIDQLVELDKVAVRGTDSQATSSEPHEAADVGSADRTAHEESDETGTEPDTERATKTGRSAAAGTNADKASYGATATLAKPDAMTLESAEIIAMKELAPLIGRSPREVKRFVNIYRLLKATDPELTNAPLIESDRHLRVFHPPMFLLAITTGTPAISGEILSRIRGDYAADEPNNESNELLIRQLVDDAARNSQIRPGHSDWNRLNTFVTRDGQWGELKVSTLARWAGRVGQYTFEASADER